MEEPAPLPDSGRHSGEFVAFVAACMAKDPFRRPTAEALLGHPFIRKVGPHLPPRHPHLGYEACNEARNEMQ